jgi:archaellum component FlaC
VSESDDIPNRVTRLEHEMREVRVLAVGADEDVSVLQDAFRAQTGLLHALRQTQVEQGRDIKLLRQRFDGVDQRFDGVDQRFDGVDQRFDGVDQRFDGVDQRFDGVDRRLDCMDQRFDSVDQRFDGMDQRFDGMDQRLGRVEDRLARVDAGITELLNRGAG